MTGCLLSATERGDQQLVKTLLKTFIHQDGATDYLQLASVPTSERIMVLAETNRKEVHQTLAAQIEYCMKFFNIPNGLNLEQIFLLTDTIIDDAGRDNLALQDVFLFLQKLSSGKMGTIYNRLDIPSFMEMFEVHREERRIEVANFRDEQQVNHKAAGPTERESDNQDREKELTRSAIGDYLRNKYK